MAITSIAATMVAVFEHPEVSDLRALALHEAAHGVIAARSGMTVAAIEIDHLDGFTSVLDLDKARPNVRLAMLMAGTEAEREFLGYNPETRPIANGDGSRIADVLMRIDRREWTSALAQARQASRRMVKVHRATIFAVAGALLERCVVAGEPRGRLDGDALFDLLDAHGSIVLWRRAAV